MRRWLGFVVGLLLVALGLAVAPSYAAGTCGYDAAAVARVDAHAFGAVAASPAQFSDMREGSASPSIEVRGTSTTSSSRSVATESAVSTVPTAGQTIYRVYSGDSAASGASWSPVDPRSVPDFRDAAGLPSGGASGGTNTGQFVIEGTLNDPSAVVLQRNALPLDGMKGGIPEYIIPNWMDNGSITINRVSGVNPGF